jgi:hypothetical protein
MNQRIQTLALKCGAWHQVYGNRNFMLNEHFEIEKFAELIVKEMCDVFDKRAEPGTGFYEPHEPAELIREHFGVEE